MTVYLIGAGPGDPGLLTRRGAELLCEADVVLFDRLVHHSLLALVPETAELVDVGKQSGAAAGPRRQEEINALLIAHGHRGGTVVRLKGGDPYVFGRGGEEGEALARAGVPFEVVPGVSSAFGVPAAAGIAVTRRGVSSAVTVVTGRVGSEGSVDWDAVARTGGTIVVLMGMESRSDITDALVHGGLSPDTPAAVIERGTTPSQRVARTTLGGLAEVTLGSPAVIVIGAVAALGATAEPLHVVGPLDGCRVVVTRGGARAGAVLDALSRAGATALHMPLTTQAGPSDGGAALAAAAATVHSYGWVVFTSANAVAAFMSHVRDARALAGVNVAAVGPSTAAALRGTGVEADLVPDVHSAAGLVASFPPPPESGGPRRLLFPSADIALHTLGEGLSDLGWEVERVEAYRTVALQAPDPALSARAAAADAVLFAAPSAVDAYRALRGGDGAALAVPPLVVCSGSATAQHARRAGLTGVVEAAGPSPEALVSALAARWGRPSPTGS